TIALVASGLKNVQDATNHPTIVCARFTRLAVRKMRSNRRWTVCRPAHGAHKLDEQIDVRLLGYASPRPASQLADANKCGWQCIKDKLRTKRSASAQQNRLLASGLP